MANDDFSNDELSTLTAINITFGALSFTGSLFIIIMYLSVKNLRSFAFKMIFFISVSDIFYSIGNMMGDRDDESFPCYVQALLLSYFELTSCFWSVAVAHTLYQVLLKKNTTFEADMEKQMNVYHAICWGLPFFLTILPFFSDSYGDSGGWCWIKTTENEKWGNAWRFIQFFIPLWVSIAFNTYVYTKVHKQLSSMAAVDHNVADEENLAGDSSGENGGEKYSMLDRVKYYPMVLVACYFFATVNRIIQMFGGSDFTLMVLHTIGAASQGTLNSLVYGMTPVVQNSFRSLVNDCMDKVGLRATRTTSVRELDDFDDIGRR